MIRCPKHDFGHGPCYCQAIIDEAFTKNVSIAKMDDQWSAQCKKGLFAVFAPTEKQAVSEAKHYFIQYYEDGEYHNED